MTLTVQQANPRAIRLYRKMGFRTVREQMRPPTAGSPPNRSIIWNARLPKAIPNVVYCVVLCEITLLDPGYVKKTDRTSATEIQRAERLRRAYLAEEHA